MRASQVAAAPKPSSISSSSGALRARGRDRRIPQRPGRRDDDERRERQPQQGEPPRRARRRLLLGGDVEQHAGRRKIDAARARRHQPQQPPQHRQAEQAEQDQRLGEGEGKARDHARSLRIGRARASGAMSGAAASGAERSCSLSRSSVAGRSVRWMMKLQPSRSVFGADFGAVALDARRIIRAPGLGPARRDGAGAFRLDEFDAARIREGFLGRVDDLHDVAHALRWPRAARWCAGSRRSGSTGRTAR